MNRRAVLGSLAASLAIRPAKGQQPSDRLAELGCLDVTKPPYEADPTGKRDSTAAIQRAVNDARDRQLVCFFPSGTYLISDTISCEQPVQKLDKPRFTDGMRQSYWDIPNRTCILMGSTSGKRPVLKLAANAKGFDDAAKPKNAVYIWAQTRNDVEGKAEPEWGKEQPNISFGHTFRGIDIDVRGHAGAVGIRHTGSQGATLQDCTILAEGAFAGMNNCPGQGGGTYNIEVRGGQYGILSGTECRFPMLCGCVFTDQTKAPVSHASKSPPMLLVGCRIDAATAVAVNLTMNEALTAVSLIDCVVRLRKPGTLFGGGRRVNMLLENCWLQGVNAVKADGKRIANPARWTKVNRYVAGTDDSVQCIDGVTSTGGEIADWTDGVAAPRYEDLHAKHWSRTPSFEDKDAVNVKSLGVKGDGKTDDTAALQSAIGKHEKLFLPKGAYRITKPLALGPRTALFGMHRSLAALRMDRVEGAEEQPAITMPNDASAKVSLTFLSLGGRVEWTAGSGVLLMAPGQLIVSKNGGGRFCGVTGIGRGFRVEDTTQPVSFYSLNVERIRTNPQSLIRGARNVRIYYLKVEAAPHGYGSNVAVGTGNTPLGVEDSRDVRIYGVNGNVVTAEKRPMVDVTNSSDVMVFHAKSFKVGEFAQIRETHAGKTVEVPSQQTLAILIRK